jgi:hypothetical protein
MQIPTMDETSMILCFIRRTLGREQSRRSTPLGASPTSSMRLAMEKVTERVATISMALSKVPG